MPTAREVIGARLRFEILRSCNFACFYCGVPATYGVKQLHIDHVIPVSLGGTNDPWNLVAACWDCNAGKTNGVPTDELIEKVRSDYCGYMESTSALQAMPCGNCGMPRVREFEDEEPLHANDICDRCDYAFHEGLKRGREVRGS